MQLYHWGALLLCLLVPASRNVILRLLVKGAANIWAGFRFLIKNREERKRKNAWLQENEQLLRRLGAKKKTAGKGGEDTDAELVDKPEELAPEFWPASRFATTLTKTKEADRLNLSALYNQATKGACNVRKPSFFDAMAKSEWEAWSKKWNMSQREASFAYVALVERLCLEQTGSGMGRVIPGANTTKTD